MPHFTCGIRSTLTAGSEPAADHDFTELLDLGQFLRQHRRCRVIKIAARHRIRTQG
jgi:hypothetical protein